MLLSPLRRGSFGMILFITRAAAESVEDGVAVAACWCCCCAWCSSCVACVPAKGSGQVHNLAMLHRFPGLLPDYPAPHDIEHLQLPVGEMRKLIWAQVWSVRRLTFIQIACLAPLCNICLGLFSGPKNTSEINGFGWPQNWWKWQNKAFSLPEIVQYIFETISWFPQGGKLKPPKNAQKRTSTPTCFLRHLKLLASVHQWHSHLPGLFSRLSVATLPTRDRLSVWKTRMS